MDKAKAEKLVSSVLKKKVKVKDIKLVGSGYHSDGYKATASNGKEYFIKAVKSKDLGFEFPERKLQALVLGHSMNNRGKASPKSLGVVAENNTLDVIPEVNDNTLFYDIQEYGGDGKSYLKILEERKDKKHIDAEDLKELTFLLDFITKIHKIKHNSKDKNQLNAIYNDYLRNIIGHQEYSLQLLHSFTDDAPILSPKMQPEFVGLLLSQMHRWKDRGDRLTALHGDFWAANIISSGKKMYVIDYSRMPWGDPGLDVGFWVSTYVFMWHQTRNNYYKELTDKFLELYIKKTGDKELMQTIVYPFGLIAIMNSSEKWVPGVSLDVRKNFYNHVVSMLKKGTFSWVW